MASQAPGYDQLPGLLDFGSMGDGASASAFLLRAGPGHPRGLLALRDGHMQGYPPCRPDSSTQHGASADMVGEGPGQQGQQGASEMEDGGRRWKRGAARRMWRLSETRPVGESGVRGEGLPSRYSTASCPLSLFLPGLKEPMEDQGITTQLLVPSGSVCFSYVSPPWKLFLRKEVGMRRGHSLPSLWAKEKPPHPPRHWVWGGQG